MLSMAYIPKFELSAGAHVSRGRVLAAVRAVKQIELNAKTLVEKTQTEIFEAPVEVHDVQVNLDTGSVACSFKNPYTQTPKTVNIGLAEVVASVPAPAV